MLSSCLYLIHFLKADRTKNNAVFFLHEYKLFPYLVNILFCCFLRDRAIDLEFWFGTQGFLDFLGNIMYCRCSQVVRIYTDYKRIRIQNLEKL